MATTTPSAGGPVTISSVGTYEVKFSFLGWYYYTKKGSLNESFTFNPNYTYSQSVQLEKNLVATVSATLQGSEVTISLALDGITVYTRGVDLVTLLKGPVTVKGFNFHGLSMSDVVLKATEAPNPVATPADSGYPVTRP